MYHKREPPFGKQLGAAWTNTHHTSNRDELLRYLDDDTVLVAFDLEGCLESVNEIGLAILRTNPSNPLVPLEKSYFNQFSAANAIEPRTIKTGRRRRKGGNGAPSLGKFHRVAEEDVKRRLQQILATCKSEDGKMILVGHSMNTEFQWMAQSCQSFLSHFDAWVDVQELIDNDCNARPSLEGFLAYLAGQDPCRINSQVHRAARDAVKTLAVLSRFVDDEPIAYKEPKPIRICWRKPNHWCRKAFRLRLFAPDEECLPQTWSFPRMIAAQLGSRDLKLVYVDGAKITNGRAHEAWIMVATESELKAVAADVRANLMDGQAIRIEPLVADWVVNAREHVPGFRL